jgi:hypothetical protein
MARAQFSLHESYLPDGSQASFAFARKAEVTLLEAADLLCWQAAKYIKDRAGKECLPRKDFLALIERPHYNLVYVNVTGPENASEINIVTETPNDIRFGGRDPYIDAIPEHPGGGRIPCLYA